MEIKLNRLHLENFKGLMIFTLSLDGKDAVIRGDNGTGKSTLMDGFIWLLFNKDSQGKADFAIKTLDNNGDEIHNLNHVVECELEIDGNITILKKEFVEKWTKKRGAAKKSFTGHTTKYFIDTVPVQKKEWDKKIQAIIDEETFKLLTSPTCFNSLHWEKRREILLQVCGDVSDEEVIESAFPSISDKENYNALSSILNKRSLDDHKKVIAGQKKVINDRLKEIPARIDELSRSIVDTSSYSTPEISAKIKNLEEKIQNAISDNKLSTIRAKRSKLAAKKADIEYVLKNEKMEATLKITEEINIMDADISKINREISDLGVELAQIANRIAQNENRMVELRGEFKEAAGSEYKGDMVCYACGQKIPEDQIKEATKKFNKKKANILSDINVKGTALKDENENYYNKKMELSDKKTSLEGSIGPLNLKIRSLQDEKNLVESQSGDPRILTEIKKIDDEILELDRQLEENKPVDVSPWQEEKGEQEKKLAEIEASKKTKARIQELMDEEKKLAGEYENQEYQTNLMEMFIKAKVNLLEHRINDKFALARFKLFDVQINGGISETCVTLYDGVPYGSGLNTGAEINVGLDIISTLSEFYKVKAPVFIDHAESVTEILNTGNQTIKLQVDEACPEMEVKYE